MADEGRTGEDAAREAQQLLVGLRDLRERTVALRRRLPEVPAAMTELAEPYTPAADLAVALEGLALDLGPLIERLETAAAVTPERLRREWRRARRPLPAGDLPGRQGRGLDLQRFSEAARRAIYDDVVRSRFQPPASARTVDDFELQVVYLFGRWLVLYRKLWDAAEPAAASAQELLVVGLNERREPVYHAV
ncbi:MAG TPA: hypothetical protein VGH73_04440 [Thermoanaerobaculia bacterium]